MIEYVDVLINHPSKITLFVYKPKRVGVAGVGLTMRDHTTAAEGELAE